MKNKETIEELLLQFDKEISNRKRKYEALDERYKNQNGHVRSSEYFEYENEKREMEKKYSNKIIECQQKINDLCKRIRKNQPALCELTPSDINKNNRIPRNIALGKYSVIYNNLDFETPKTISFPFKHSMYITNETKHELLHKVILRLLCTLPINTQQYYIYDPKNLGENIGIFRKIFNCENLFPTKKILIDKKELKKMLEEEEKYILNLNTNVFNIENKCNDWESYNRFLYSQRKFEKMLPYKVFIFNSVHYNMDEESAEILKTFINIGSKYGILVLFSFDEKLIFSEKEEKNKVYSKLKECIKQSLPLHKFLIKDNIDDYENLKVSDIGEKFPNDIKLDELLENIKKIANENMKKGISFEELLNNQPMFSGESLHSLEIPIGVDQTFEVVNVKIGDEVPHYLIAGGTGSGKSNLLNTLITSACTKYSPEELKVYLMDLKEGVEYNKFTNPCLKHAELVSIETNIAFSQKVLMHIVEEHIKRSEKFKKIGTKDIISYNENVEKKERMPRILFIIDEFQELFSKTVGDIQKLFNTIVRKARSSGIHLILSTQTLSGLDLDGIDRNIGGRIALKCTASDSVKILGGNENDAASKIKIPYAILNTANGEKSENIKISVPRADDKIIKKVLMKINEECEKLNIKTETKIFNGEKLPIRPESPIFDNEKTLQICFGESMDYDVKPIILKLENKERENILVFGHDDNIKKSLLNSIIISGTYSKFCDEIIYIGENKDLIYSENKEKLIQLNTIEEFLENYFDDFYSKKRILIVDEINLNVSINIDQNKEDIKNNKNDIKNFKPIANFNPTENFKKITFDKYLDNANKNGSFIVYMENKKDFVQDKLSKFINSIVYSCNSSELGTIVSNSTPDRGLDKEILLVKNKKPISYFRQYKNIGEENENY